MENSEDSRMPEIDRWPYDVEFHSNRKISRKEQMIRDFLLNKNHSVIKNINLSILNFNL